MKNTLKSILSIGIVTTASVLSIAAPVKAEITVQQLEAQFEVEIIKNNELAQNVYDNVCVPIAHKAKPYVQLIKQTDDIGLAAQYLVQVHKYTDEAEACLENVNKAKDSLADEIVNKYTAKIEALN